MSFEDATAQTLAMKNVMEWFPMRSLMTCLGNDKTASSSLTRQDTRTNSASG